MARISDVVIQGLMNPQFGFTGLAEPIGMLMGGAQAQRQAQQRQMQAIQGALGAQDIGALQEVLKDLKPDEVKNVLAVYGAGQQARAQQAEQKRQRTDVLAKDAEEIAARTSAVRHAVINEKDPETGIMLRSAPMSVVNAYLQDKVIPKEGAGNFEFFSAPGGVAVVDPATGKVTFEASPYGEGQKPAKSKGQVRYTKPDGSVVSLTTDEFGKVTYNGESGFPEQFGLSAQPMAPAEGEATQKRYRTPEGRVVSITTPKSGVISFGGKTGFAEDLGLTLLAPPKPPSVAIENMALEAGEAARTAAAQAETAAKAEAVFTEREGTLKGALGRAAGDVKRVFGKGDELSQAYADVRGLRISDVLKFLPPGPASNADVQLVMSTTIDPIDMDDETLKKWLGAYRRIKQGQAAYYRAQNAYISKNQSNLGFDSSWNLDQTAKAISSSPTFEEFMNAYNAALAKPDSPQKRAEISDLRATEDYKLMEAYETYKKQVEEFEASR